MSPHDLKPESREGTAQLAMATITRRRKLIPRPRPADPTPAPAAPVEPSRLYRGQLPDTGTRAVAVCGCTGLVRYTSRHHGGHVRLLIQDPCSSGWHERWVAGCTAGFPANQITAVVDDAPQPALFPTTGRTAAA